MHFSFSFNIISNQENFIVKIDYVICISEKARIRKERETRSTFWQHFNFIKKKSKKNQKLIKHILESLVVSSIKYKLNTQTLYQLPLSTSAKSQTLAISFSLCAISTLPISICFICFLSSVLIVSVYTEFVQVLVGFR